LKEVYEEFKTRLGCLKLAQQVVTTALAAAKAAKENYDSVQISVYREVYLAAEKKAAAATLRSQKAGKELEEIWDQLQRLLLPQVFREAASAHSCNAQRVINNEMPESLESERIMDESEDLAVIDTPNYPDTLSTNRDKFSLADRGSPFSHRSLY
jgi:hypothetical protein